MSGNLISAFQGVNRDNRRVTETNSIAANRFAAPTKLHYDKQSLTHPAVGEWRLSMKKMCFSAIAVLMIALAGTPAYGQALAGQETVPQVPLPLSLVNITQGTDSDRAFSHGNTLPLVSEPWSMTDWCIQNRAGINERWFYQFKNKQFFGFRATHSPCPWAGDYGQFMITPQTGPLVMAASEFACDYDPDQTIMRPDYVRVKLNKYHLTAELTASERCGVIRLHFDPADKTGRLLFDLPGNAQLQAQGNRIFGYTKYHSNTAVGDFHSYFVAEMDRPTTYCRPVGTADAVGKGMGFVEFSLDKPMVELRVATSYISQEQAWHNLETETRGGFDAVRERTAAAWQQQLTKIRIEATPDQQATFYTCLYRAMKFPHKIYELDNAGKPTHYSPWDGKIHSGVAYADSGMWDTYRTLFPFLSIGYPKQLGEIVAGWLNAYREGGWLPQWPDPGGFRGMPGSHADAMIADAMSKAVPGFDYETAYTALRHDALDIPTRSNPGGREHLGDYERLGYLPAKSVGYWVSSTLDFAYDDWCVAQAAKLMHHNSDYQALMQRSMNYRNLWDPGVRFMRSKDAKGNWADADFDEFAWGNGYAESGPWQASWAVQHDVVGLADLAGGPKEFAAILDHLFHQPSVFHLGGYKDQIHEMTEFAAINMSQFAINNQPSFHLPYLYAAVGQPWKTEYWTRRACGELFNAGPDGYSGDEDNGSNASWYLLSAMGFYPLTPGQPSYVLTSPLFRGVKIYLPNEKIFTITTVDNSEKNIYVRSRTLNGEADTNTWISQSQITNGGTLVEVMSDTPNQRTVTAAELPYSAKIEMSQDQK
jgi:predicted alpha-1,2-mannosidase